MSDAFCGPAWMLLDSAQKCDKEEVCWPRGTRPHKQWKCGQAEPEPSFQVLTGLPPCTQHASRSQELSSTQDSVGFGGHGT